MRPPFPGEDHRAWEPAEGSGIPDNPDGRRILVIEDDAPIREVLVTTLRLSGYHVASIGEGAHAIDLAEEFRPELVLMDLMLPDVDGWELTSRIRQHPALGNPPVVVLSARVHERDRLRAFEAGAVHYLTKPCRAMDLLETIRAFLPESGEWRDPSGPIALNPTDLDEATDSPESVESLSVEIEDTGDPPGT